MVFRRESATPVHNRAGNETAAPDVDRYTEVRRSPDGLRNAGAALVDLVAPLVEITVDRVLERLEVSAARKPLLLTQADAAVVLGISVPTLRRLLDEGCPSVRVCNTQRVIIADVLAWLRAREAERAKNH